MNLDVVILAAGKGTRMRSQHAKVLHSLAGSSLIEHVMRTAAELKPRSLAVVVGHAAQEVQAHVGDGPIWVQQTQQLGTGHAVKLAMEQLPDDGVVLVLYGDVPLVTLDTLQRAIEAAARGGLGVVTAEFSDPAELGRIVRDESDRILGIVEYKDASDEQRAIREINSGIVAAPGARLRKWLERIENDNAQGEYYLTDIVALAVSDGIDVEGVQAGDAQEVTGVNDRAQLAQLERLFQMREAQRLMREGVTIADPERVDIRGQVSVGEDCYLDVNVVLQGAVTLGRGVHVGPGVVISDSEIGDNVAVHPHTVVEGAVVAANCSLGPFARIRAGTKLDDGVKIGNFVETKKAHLGAGTKASHLAYLGDATVGAECNIGAGTITCNYDGVDKHETVIGDNVFVGTNSTLVAPVEVADDAFVAAGSSVTVKVERGDLAVGRAKQRNIKGWKRPGQRGESDTQRKK